MAGFQKTIVITALAGFWLISSGWAVAQKAPAPPAQQNTIVSGSATLPAGDAAVQRAAKEMAEAALNFWAALTPELQAKCAFPFDADERFNWHYIPRERKGITWNDMTPAQQALAHALLASGLSSRGYRQAESIMSLDQVLKEMEQGKGPLRDPNNYAFSVFGKPGEHATWGWRFEGHHLSLTFTIVDGQAVAGPVFFGTNPATVLEGPRKGLRVLAVEEDLGRELFKSLTPEQTKIAIYDVTAPKDVITTNTRKANPGPPVGVAAGDMTAAQQKLLMTLVENYAYRLRPELADQDLSKIAVAGFKEIHFAWAGGVEPGQPHYYRLHGPTFLVEFDNTQNNANHIHTVWRDSANDFGEDLLRAHYDKHKNEPDHGHDQ
jgi:hypothetical protein